MTEKTLTIASKEDEDYALGGMVTNHESLEIGLENLCADDFFHEENKVIFNAINHLKQSNAFDFYNLERHVGDFLQRENINGFDYRGILKIIYLKGFDADMKFYVKTLKEFSAKRKLIESHKDIFNDIQNGKSFLDIIEKQKKNFEAIEQGLIREDKFNIKCIADLGENWLYETPPAKKMLLEYIDDNKKTQGFIPKGNVCMLVGMGGIGKSHWVAQLTASVVTKTLFLDKFTPTTDCDAGNVFLGLAENDLEDIRRMLHKSTKYLREKPEPNSTPAQIKYDLEHKIYPFSFHGQQCQFIKDGEPSKYFYELKRHLIKNAPKGGWALIILDPISRFLGAEAETDNAAATSFIALMEQLTMELPGKPTILFCHHMNKGAINGDASGQGAARGSSAITDGVRLQINLRRLTESEIKSLPEAEKSLELTMMTMSKTNFTRILEDIALEKESDGYISKYSKTNISPKMNSTNESEVPRRVKK
jgi:hypothetical protein